MSTAAGAGSTLEKRAAVAFVALFSFVVVVRPMLGAMFLWDDWWLLERVARVPLPERWLLPEGDHWSPLLAITFDLEYRVFGAHHDLFVIATWVVHCVNARLLVEWLERATGDVRAAALATCAVGAAVVSREVIWWAELTSVALALTVTLWGLLEIERAVVRGPGARTAAVLALVAFAAPSLHGLGISVGIVLAVEAWLVIPAPRKARARLVLAALGSLAAYVAILSRMPLASEHTRLPHTLPELGLALSWFVEQWGNGLVAQTALVPLTGGTGNVTEGAGLLLGYLGVLGLVAVRLEGPARRRLLAIQALPAILFAAVASKRWGLRDLAFSSPLVSRYQYLPVLAWSALVAFGIVAASRRRPRQALGLAALGVVALAAGHAREVAGDRSIPGRLQSAEFIRHIVAVAGKAHGPLWDAELSNGLHASKILSLLSPETSVVWTSSRTDATLEPYLADPYFQGHSQ